MDALRKGYEGIREWPYERERKALIDLGYLINRLNFKVKTNHNFDEERAALEKIISLY